jgi:hypothetical protein
MKCPGPPKTGCKRQAEADQQRREATSVTRFPSIRSRTPDQAAIDGASPSLDDVLSSEDIACLGMHRADRADFFADIRAAERAALAKLQPSRRQRKAPRLTLAAAIKQTAKAGVTLVSYEERQDGSTVVTITNAPESTEANVWLADLKRKDKQQ